MAQILDYSVGYPGAVSIARLGFAGGIRYLRKEGTSSVLPLTVAEVLDYESRNLELALVYQHVRKSRVLEGRAAGRHDAAWALAQARDCGVEPRAIYFAVDFDTIGPEQWAAVREYMLGAGEVLGLGRVGTYGEYDLLDYLFARGSITWGWQTYAWSTGHNKDNQPRHPRAHLFQRLGQVTVNGISCDVNDVLRDDWGQHNYREEDDMYSDADRTDAKAAQGRILAALAQGTPVVKWGPLAGLESVWIVQQLLEHRALLAAVAAAQQDDVSDQDVLARLGEHVDAGMAELQQRTEAQLEQFRAEAEAARAADRAATEAAVREVLGENNPALADAVVNRIAERLVHPAA